MGKLKEHLTWNRNREQYAKIMADMDKWKIWQLTASSNSSGIQFNVFIIQLHHLTGSEKNKEHNVLINFELLMWFISSKFLRDLFIKHFIIF